MSTNEIIFKGDYKKKNDLTRAFLGKGDKASGKLMVETLIENNTIGGNFIKYGFDLNIFIGKPNDKEEGWKQDFYNYLDRGGEKNVGT